MSAESKKKWIKTLKFLAAYLVAAWTFLQFVDWVLNRYSISPHWVDILLWFFIGITPSLLIYFYHQERLSKRIVKLREKIIIPLNVILLITGLYFGFGNSDLGATTKKINYTDEQGLAQSETITKEEFRIGVPIYGFNNLSDNDSINWLEYGIGRLLEEDLLQNKSLSPDFQTIYKTSYKIEEASLFNDFYIDGEYTKEGDEYTVTAYKRKATNGKILQKKTFKGAKILPLIDDIAVFVTENSGFVETQQLRYLDYPLNEFMSDSIEAIKAYLNNDFYKATDIDEDFAMAYLANAKRSLRISRGKLEVQDLTDKAFENRSKLPKQKQLEVYIQRNLAYENYEDAAEQVKLQLEVDPHNQFYNQVLFSIYGETKQTEEFLESSWRLFDIDQDPETGTNLAIAAMVNGDDQMLIDEIKKYELISPNLKIFRIQPLLFKGDVAQAEDLLKDIETLYPGYKYRATVYDSAVAFQKKYGNDISRLKKFEGSYRSNHNEQIHTLWIEHNRLIQYVKNQKMNALLPAGNTSAATGFVNDQTYRHDLVFDENGDTLGYFFCILNYNNTNKFWFWKEDETIKKAHEAFDDKDFAKAEQLYELAVAENPKHIYLKNYLDHLKYIKAMGQDSLVKQHEKYVGTYGPREFWIEDNRFYYKRQDETTNLPRLELLPINANTYMDVTRPGTLMLFEPSDNGKLASVSHSFNTDTWEFEVTSEGENYFVKD